MVNRWLFFCQVLTVLSCSVPPKVFEEISCSNEEVIPNDNLRNIFKPCRTFIYRAQYWDLDRNLISDELIRVDVPGTAWEYQPESQDEIVIQYQYDPEDIDSLEKYSLNPVLNHWTSKTTTGIIETADRVWIHPFRSNQYNFTEVAPFPEVDFPLEVGKIWSGNLSILDGWGVWEHSTLNHVYEVVGYESFDTPLGPLEAWHIYSHTSATFGSSSHDFWFHEKYGFVKMVVQNYRNQLLQFELIEVFES